MAVDGKATIKSLLKNRNWIRKYGFNHPKVYDFLVAYLAMGTVTAACKKSNVSCGTVALWKRGYLEKPNKEYKGFEDLQPKSKYNPEFHAKFTEVFEFCVDLRILCLEEEAERRAMEGSDALLMFMLKARRPQVFRERMEGLIPVNNTLQMNTLNLTGDQTEKVMKLAQEMGLMDRLLKRDLPSGMIEAMARVDGKPPVKGNNGMDHRD